MSFFTRVLTIGVLSRISEAFLAGSPDAMIRLGQYTRRPRALWRQIVQTKASSVDALPELLLASKSPTRKQILSEMGFKFTCVPAGLDEKAIGDRLCGDPDALVLAIARAKAKAVMNLGEFHQTVSSSRAQYLLAGDQVVVFQGKIIEKPRDAEEARYFMRSYASAPCRTVGSVVLVNLVTGETVEGVDSAQIYWKEIPENVIDTLIREGDCMHCAGGLMIEHPILQPYIERVDGTIDSVMGLSKELVLRLLGQLMKPGMP